jgi:hypothetical protein
MQCPTCQAELAEPFTRFCDGCGLANPYYRPPPKATATKVPLEVRCDECGLLAVSRRCRGCGAAVKWPEGVSPPGE